MSKAENFAPVDADEIRRSLGPARMSHAGGTMTARVGGGTVTEYGSWVDGETGAPLYHLFSPERSLELRDLDDIRASVIEQMRLLRPESGLKPEQLREQLAHGLNPVGARVADQVPVIFLVIPTVNAVNDAEKARSGQYTFSPPIPVGNRDFDTRGIEGYLKSYQRVMKGLTRTEEPLTVGDVRNLSVDALRSRCAGLSRGSIKLAQSFLQKR